MYLLSMILHDWTDEEAHRLLASIRRAIPSDGRLLIVDAVLPPGDTPHFGKLLDLTMMAMLTGRERTEEEFAELLDTPGSGSSTWPKRRLRPASSRRGRCEGAPDGLRPPGESCLRL